MRAKAETGAGSLADHELLEILLYGGIPYKDTNPVAHELLFRFGSLSGVFSASTEELTTVPNMTYNAAVSLRAVGALIRRVSEAELPTSLTPKTAVPYLAGYFRGKTNEEFLVIALDARDRVVRRSTYAGEDAECVSVDLRRLFGTLLPSEATGVIVAHNHPSGRLEPSRADLAATETMRMFLAPLGIRLADHYIVTPDGQVYSIEYGCSLT